MNRHEDIRTHQRAGNFTNENTVIEAYPKAAEADAANLAGYCHEYQVVIESGDGDREHIGTIEFQDGPPGEVGINGLTNEILIAILVDRLERFQAGPHRCRENALAITKLEEAGHWLNHRTGERAARGVEGTLKP